MRRGGSGALRRAPPRSWPRGSFCLRQQKWHSPHCETHALVRADAPTTGRLEPSGLRQARGGSCYSPGEKGGRRSGVLASRVAESVGVSAWRFTSGAKNRRLSFFWPKSRNYKCRIWYLKHSVGSGMVSNHVRPIRTVRGESHTDRLAESPTWSPSLSK